MIEVFITDIQTQIEATKTLNEILTENVDLKISFDLNETEFSFPCGHTILRVESHEINSDKILDIIRNQGFKCEILEDKICAQKEIMKEFWEEAFKEKQEMWGLSPAKSTVLTKDFFVENKVKFVLIPGIGYGRNAQVFIDNGMMVAGIEISQTAIDLAQKHFGNSLRIFHGSVTEMPFDHKLYEGIFCYGLIYLLNKDERKKLINDCFNQLTENGFMVFTAITKDAQTYGQGKQISKDQFEMFGGVKIFFYDKETIEEEFGTSGLFEITEVIENYPFYLIKCKNNKATCENFTQSI